MEVGQAEREKLQVQVPWIPTTPLQPTLPVPVPILFPGEEDQLGSHSNGVPACFEFSAGAEVKNRLPHRSKPPAEACHQTKRCVKISFDDVSSQDNGIAELFAQADAPSTYSTATRDLFLKNQFVPTFNTQFNPSYALHSHHHLSREQPLVNTIHDKYQDVQGTPHFAYYSKTTPYIPPTPHKLNDPTIEVAVASTPGKELNHDIDLNKVPQQKQRRKKHRPKVITEGKPQRTRKPVTPKLVQPKENPTGTRKSTRKGSNMTSTTQTEVTEEWTKPLMSESTKKTCRRSLNFDVEEPREIGVVVEGAQALNNFLSLQATQAPSTYLSKSISPGTIALDGHENSRGLSKSVAQSSRKDSISSNSENLTTRSRLHVIGPKRKHSSTVEHAGNSSINLIGAQYNAVQAYCLESCVQFPNVPKKRRTEKGKFSNTSNTPCLTATKDVQAATCPPEDGQRRPTKTSRVPTRTDDCASPTSFRSSSGRQTFGVAEGLKTCADALSAEMQATLNIRREHDQNAIVPYNQQNTLIPIEEPVNPTKKQRPKVDLDEETNKVWKLLMLDINSHGIDGTDELKAKWWEEERNVFRGRADSFIARMHLVQGDRRFSQWKGSVVDSVVGVFLTQNVSDHLSSSAFMSLAARFPLSNKHKTDQKESTSLMVNEPQVQLVEPEENSTVDEKILNQSVYESGSTPVEIINRSEDREAVDSNDSCRTTGCLISLTDESSCKLLESTQSHSREQNPVESGSTTGATEKGNLCAGSVAKALNDVFSDSYSVEDQSSTAMYNIFNDRTPFCKLLEMACSTMLHEVNCQSGKSVENLRDRDGQSIGMSIDNTAQNLEKSNVTQASLDASTISCNEYTLTMTPNSGVLEVNCYDPLKMEVPSTSSSKNKDEIDKRINFPTDSNSQAATANSQVSGQTQDPLKKAKELDLGDHNYAKRKGKGKKGSRAVKLKKKRALGKKKKAKFNWDSLRIKAKAKAGKREKTENTMDSLDWDAVRRADVNEIADIIKERGMNNLLAERIKNFLNLLVDVHGAIDLEWLRDVPPDKVKEYLLSINGLGLKSVECVRLLTLHHLAFPVDTNVGRIAVRLGWVPLQPLPESLQLHLLELYPVLESIQKYLWPRLCKLDQRTLYELHYQLITFGKVFCTKNKPNCNACPMRGECRHFASAFASARLALPGPEQKSIIIATGNNATHQNTSVVVTQVPLPLLENQAEELQQAEVIQQLEPKSEINICQPIIEEPASPEPGCPQLLENDIEDAFYEESCEIPTIKLNIEEFTSNLQNYMQQNMELQEGETSKAMVALHPNAARIPTPKLKNVSRLRTEHCVYELPDTHCLLEGWDKREQDDPGTYLLAIWTPGETAHSIQPPERKCSSQDSGQLCNEKDCLSCNSFREANSQIVRGTILIPCRTAMRGSFPLNGTYFQVNEVFADHDSSLNPISVPRSWIWNLNRRTVYFGTSIPTIFKGLSTREIQECFWKGYVCVRGFDRETRAPRPLMARLHFPASRSAKKKDKTVVPGSRLPKKNKTKTRSTANSRELNLKANQEQPRTQLERKSVKAKITFEEVE